MPETIRRCRQCPNLAELVVSVSGEDEFYCQRCYENVCNGFSGCVFPGNGRPPTTKLYGGKTPDKPPKDCTMAERRLLYSSLKNPPATDAEARRLERVLWLFREMPRIKPAFVLDVGCESGFITRWMVDEPYVKHLVGIDPCEFSIKHAENMVRKRHSPEKAMYQVKGWEDFKGVARVVLEGHMPSGPEEANDKVAWDSVVCFEVIEHFLPSEGVELINKVHSLLSPGGTAFVCTPSPEGRYGLYNMDQWHLKIYAQKELDDMVQSITGCTPSFEALDPDFTMLKWRKK